MIVKGYVLFKFYFGLEKRYTQEKVVSMIKRYMDNLIVEHDIYLSCAFYHLQRPKRDA